MMTPEQLRAAYAHGYVGALAIPQTDEEWSITDDRAHIAGFAEVARQQAEVDAQIAENVTEIDMRDQWGPTIAAAIRAQSSAADE